MKTITMSETRAGSPDGIAVNSYLAGETYTVPTELADIFTANDWAAETDAPAKQTEESAVAESSYAGLSDEELAAKVLEHDPAADPDAVAQAIAADRAAVEAALPPAEPTAEESKALDEPENKALGKPKNKTKRKKK